MKNQVKYLGSIVLIGVVFFFSISLGSGLKAGQEDPRLNKLFANLVESKNVGEAKATENSIWKIWLENKNPSVVHIMTLGIQAMNAGDLKASFRAFNEVVKMAPNYAEGWNKRATIYYLLQDYPASVEDIAHTLRLEPRHFGALSGLGLINAALGRHGAAVKAFEQALSIHPYMRGARQHIKILKEFLKGEET